MSNSNEHNYSSGHATQQYHPTPEQLKVRKSYRMHRRTSSHGSGNFASLTAVNPKGDPETPGGSRRRVSCHGTPRIAMRANADLPPPYGSVVGSEIEPDGQEPPPPPPPPEMVCGYEYKLPEQVPRMGEKNDGGDLEEVDAVNSNSIVLYERYSTSLRRRSIGASSTSSDDECRIVVPGDNEMEADDRYLQNLGRKVSMIAAEASQAQLQRGDRAGSGRTARRSLRKISPGTARRLSTVSNNNNSSSNAQMNEGLSSRNLELDQHPHQHPVGMVSDVIRFDDDEYGDADSTDSREEEEEEDGGCQKAAKWSDDPADDSEEENPRFMLRRRR